MTYRGSYWYHYYFPSLSGIGTIDCPFSKIGNDIKVSGVVACLEGRDGTQRDLDRLGRLGGVIVMKVNRTKCNVLNLNWSNLNTGH